MDRSLENRIRERAYEIWVAHDCVHGQADQHWLTAERTRGHMRAWTVVGAICGYGRTCGKKLESHQWPIGSRWRKANPRHPVCVRRRAVSLYTTYIVLPAPLFTRSAFLILAKSHS